MPALTRREAIALLLAAPSAARAFAAESEDWIPLFDGKSLHGWKASEHTGTFKVEDGQIVAHGERSHLFYVGNAHHADFKNFDLRAEVMTRPGANSGIYIHTAYQPNGFPSAGFEVQVANTHVGADGYRENKKTGSLYGVRNVYKQLVKDNEWFRMNIVVRGKQVQIRVNDMLVVDYVEPEPPFRSDLKFGRVLNRGTFALQGHDPGSTTYFKNISCSSPARHRPATFQRAAPG
jgi:hypothetical protein